MSDVYIRQVKPPLEDSINCVTMVAVFEEQDLLPHCVQPLHCPLREVTSNLPPWMVMNLKAGESNDNTRDNMATIHA